MKKIIPFYIIHLIVVGIFYFNVIPQTGFENRSLFIFHSGGDEKVYFQTANNILNAKLAPAALPIGYSLFLIPFVGLFSSYSSVVSAVSFFWSVILFPVGQFLLYRISKKITESDKKSAVIVFLWTMLPIIIYIVHSLIGDQNAGLIASHLIWAQMLTDGPTTFFTLLFTYIFISKFLLNQQNTRWIIILGMLGGYMTLVRYTAIIPSIAMGIVLLYGKKIKQALIFSCSCGIGMIPQLWHNAYFFGNPLKTGYTQMIDIPTQGLFNLKYLTDIGMTIWSKYTGFSLIIMVVFILLYAKVMREIIRKNKRMAVYITLIIWGYLLVYGTYYFTWIGNQARFFMPIFPYVILLGVLSISNNRTCKTETS